MALPPILQKLEELRRDARHRNMREIERIDAFVRLSSRVTHVELALIDGEAVSVVPDGGGGRMEPSGYKTLTGAVVAPVSVVGPGASAPLNAALTLEVEAISS